MKTNTTHDTARLAEAFAAAIEGARLSDTPERMAIYREVFALGWNCGALDAMRSVAGMLCNRDADAAS